MNNHTKNIDSLESWSILKKEQNSVLIDVRTEIEWKLDGVIDLTSINRKVYFLSMTNNLRGFIEEFINNYNDKSTLLLFICKSGVRSLKAAQLINAQNYHNCYNIYDGFDGDNNNTALGWKKNALPWRYLK